MSLKKVSATLKNKLKNLSARLALSYIAFFALSSVFMFAVVIVSVDQFLEKKDHDIIDARISQYQAVYDQQGRSGLQDLAEHPNSQNQADNFLINLRGAENKNIFLHLPFGTEDIDLQEMQKTLAKPLKSATSDWRDIASVDGDEDALQVHGLGLKDGNILFVGARSSGRDQIIGRISGIFLLLLIPILLVAVVGAFYFSQNSLQPIRQLIKAASRIKEGDLSSRVPVTDTQDELYELSSLFNEMVDRVEGLVSAMKDTLDNVAHDLKTPITRIKVAGELALRSGDAEQAKLALEETIENCDEIQNLISSIMIVSKISAKTAQLNVSEFALKGLIDEVIDVYQFVADEKSISIEINVNESLRLKADRALFKQAVANLLDNALKYSRPQTRVKIRAHIADGKILLEVADQGIGISGEDQPRIWERLYRGDKSRHEPGLGLGLSLVRAIIEAHQGQIVVESQNGQGSLFRVSLPI